MIVIQIDNERARQLIEAYTDMYCQPDVIKFVQDGIGNWIMSKENLDNPKYKTPDQQTLSKFLLVNNVTDAFTSITEVVNMYGVEVEHIPIVYPENETT